MISPSNDDSIPMEEVKDHDADTPADNLATLTAIAADSFSTMQVDGVTFSLINRRIAADADGCSPTTFRSIENKEEASGKLTSSE